MCLAYFALIYDAWNLLRFATEDMTKHVQRVLVESTVCHLLDLSKYRRGFLTKIRIFLKFGTYFLHCLPLPPWRCCLRACLAFSWKKRKTSFSVLFFNSWCVASGYFRKRRQRSIAKTLFLFHFIAIYWCVLGVLWELNKHIFWGDSAFLHLSPSPFDNYWCWKGEFHGCCVTFGTKSGCAFDN